MRKLYKYMSERAALSFIRDPQLRVTPRWALNDPFECQLTSSTIEHLDIHRLDDKCSRYVQDFIDKHGIVSLSETPDNLLMWSHYSEEHRGAVVELLIDETKPFSIFQTKECPVSSDALFNKVSYRKCRTYPSKENRDLEALRDHYYLTKGVDWIYEKEHRYIFPVTSLSSVLLDENNTADVSDHLGWRDLDNTLGMNSICCTHPERLLSAWSHSRNSDAMFFVRLDSRSVGRLILGVNADIQLFQRAMRDGEQNHRTDRNFVDSIIGRYNDVYRARIDPERFELCFEPLDFIA
ncbi:DUF2971 domain-containing protein [Vibrio agarivorans]|uniref:DUF2971 domain-containing protein n=1 Tax=Vibrio agarivorans TaxID=153622 RepID=A0ABT7Y436_9VIBR|nr:DUF2971 domain-containing protein [Vibrio agarivorans]MDN2482775.1 DUF2971 domain-containing protein [Vibrio agarivorans]